MSKVLELVFKTDLGKEATYSISDPKEGLTKEEVTAAANMVVSKNIFQNLSGDLKELSKAQIKEVSYTQIV